MTCVCGMRIDRDPATTRGRHRVRLVVWFLGLTALLAAAMAVARRLVG